MKIDINRLFNNPTLIILLGSLMFFLVKGVRYALIDSYVPLSFIIVMIVLGLVTTVLSKKMLRRVIKFWGIFLVMWSLGRFVIEILFYFSPNVTEAHIRDQFTVFQNLLNVVFLLSGIHLIRSKLESIL